MHLILLTCLESSLLLAGPPPYLLFANVVDIRQMNIDGTQSKKLLEEPKGTILAVDYDPVENKVGVQADDVTVARMSV